MSLSEQQISALMNMLSETKPDCLDCDGCFEQIAEFAEQQLTSKNIPEAMQHVETHLKQCACCHAEYQVLLEALKEMGQGITDGEVAS